MMRVKVFCSKINKEVYLTFDIIQAATLKDPYQYTIGLISECSICGKNICKQCLLADTLTGQLIDKKF